MNTYMGLQERRRYVPYTRGRNYACRITESIFHGLRCVTLENQAIRVSVAADKGADIYEFLHKPTDTELLLRTALGLRRQPPALPTINLREGSFCDFYEGGWQELFPVAGDFASESNGAQFGQHGEVALLPWSYHINEDGPARISVTFSVDTTRTPFHLDRTMILEDGEPALQIQEHLRNEGDEAIEFMWAHHPAFGWPFLEEGCQIELPPCEVVVLGSELPATSRLIEQESEWPNVKGKDGAILDLSQMPGPETKAHDLAFMRGLPEGRYSIRNPRSRISFHLVWQNKIFPYLWYWQVTRGAFGYPWYGTTYNLALEPHSSLFPMLQRAIEQHHTIKLDPMAEICTELEASISQVG
jgi:galactose mutarotase-like enzyme